MLGEGPQHRAATLLPVSAGTAAPHHAPCPPHLPSAARNASSWRRPPHAARRRPALARPLAPTSPPAAPCPPAGREGRGEFGARSGLKKKKTGGLSNREKDKRKRLPMAARSGQVRAAGPARSCRQPAEAGRGRGARAGRAWQPAGRRLQACAGSRRGLSPAQLAHPTPTPTPRPPQPSPHAHPTARCRRPQVRKRLVRNKLKSSKNFKGHQRQ